MPGTYQSKDGSEKSFDLDTVIDVVRGYSGQQPGWTALIVFLPKEEVFVELRSSPPDIRGNSRGEEEEVSEEYLLKNFQLSTTDINQFRAKPKKWVFRDYRQKP